MHLTRLEVQGFKTFAKKTTVTFPSPRRDKHALTVIVGPNGSGKSNLSDAIRWCLGEQSMKQLRGKKSEDIIFSGSKGRGRAGFAEVVLTFDNSDNGLDIDYSEVTITRRLYRDGDSEYLMNGKRTRLTDIQLILAEAGIGQRTYTVIGQGMVDHVLTASPEERKVFFDDATGVRGLQMKRHQSMLKLKRSTENLVEVEMLLGEIEPRLRLLRRQVRRLEKRESVEAELRELQMRYFGTLWWKYRGELSAIDKRLSGVREQITQKQAELDAGDKELLEMEQIAVKKEPNMQLAEAQQSYRNAQKQLREAQQAQFSAERDLEMEKIKAQSSWAPLPLDDIVSELEKILKAEESGVMKLLKMVRSLRDRLTKPNPADFTPSKRLVKAVNRAKDSVQKLIEKVKQAERSIDGLSKNTQEPQTDVFAFQRKLRKIQSGLHALQTKENKLNIEKARVETRLEGLEEEIDENLPTQKQRIIAAEPEQKDTDQEKTRSRMLRLKSQLELIGGIDEETIDEYQETKERHDFLQGQLNDLRGAIQKSEKIIDELDSKIRKQSEKAFKRINKEFQKYFKVLFGGGSCSLVKLKTDDADEEDTKVALDRAMEEMAEDKLDKNSAEAMLARFKKRRDIVSGIDIQATPPGKKLKGLNLLSGGERALTSIALLSAIMATNPSPFVVLDEVDAALDEANTIRFANILDELRKLTQFIVITHNRATMERADLLYGVTMGDDGTSNLLSVNLADVKENGTA